MESNIKLKESAVFRSFWQNCLGQSVICDWAWGETFGVMDEIGRREKKMSSSAQNFSENHDF